jgi:hypothetical protein
MGGITGGGAAPVPGANPGGGAAPVPGGNPGGFAAPVPGANPGGGAAPVPGANPGGGAAPVPGGNPGGGAAPVPGANPGGGAAGGAGGAAGAPNGPNGTSPNISSSNQAQPVTTRAPRQLSAQPPLTQDQTNTLNLFRGIAERQGATPSEKNQVLEVFRGAALDKETMEELKDISENLAALVFSDPSFAAAITGWPNYDTEQRKKVMSDFVKIASDYLGIDPSLEFFSTPAINGTFEGGFFDGSTNTLSMNTIPEAIGSLASTLQILAHELTHAFKHDQIAGISPAEIVRRTTNGTMSYTDALIAFAGMVGLSYSFPDVSFDDYQRNMHEQAAFTGEHFWQEAAKQYGLTPERESLTAENPLFKNLQAAGLA